MYRHYQLRVQWGMDTYFVYPYTAWQHRNQRTPQRSEPTFPTHTPTSEPSPRKNCRKSSPRSTTNPENTSTRQHRQNPTNTTHNNTPPVLPIQTSTRGVIMRHRMMIALARAMKAVIRWLRTSVQN